MQRRILPAIVRSFVLGAVGSLAAASGIGLPARAGAQQQRVLRGHVVDKTSRGAIPGAIVILDANGRAVTTDSSGAYELVDIGDAPVALTVRALSYPVLRFTLDLAGAGPWTKDLALDSTLAGRRVAKLGPVDVKADAPVANYRLHDFEIRRATGRGQYLTDDEIRKSGATNVQDAVRAMRGVLLDCGGTMYGGCRVRMSRAPERCLPEYIVDGQVDNDFGPTTPIRDVIAIEVYTGPSDVPGDFAGTNAGCGVIALWTRSGPDRPGATHDSSGHK